MESNLKTAQPLPKRVGFKIALILFIVGLSRVAAAVSPCSDVSIPANPPASTPGISLTLGTSKATLGIYWDACTPTSGYQRNFYLSAISIQSISSNISTFTIADSIYFRQSGVVERARWNFTNGYSLSIVERATQFKLNKPDSALAKFFDPRLPLEVISAASGQVILTIPAPEAVVADIGNVTGLWWNRAESGWGINLNHQGDKLFATLFTYDGTGRGMWLVMPNGQAAGQSFSGDLYITRGSVFDALPFKPLSASDLTRVGSLTIEFPTPKTANLSYSINGVSISKRIEPQIFATPGIICTQSSAINRASQGNYTDLWWNAAESGWGVNLTHQADTMFATLFTYDFDSKGMWLVMSNGVKEADGSFKGDLLRTTGPAFNSVPFLPVAAANTQKVGTMTLRFNNGDAGTLSYTYNGFSVTKTITRQVFGTQVPICARG